jgi:pimeloyl-ACP methyl ester carboxylesterase
MGTEMKGGARVFCLASWGGLPQNMFWPSLCKKLKMRGHTVILQTKPCRDDNVDLHVKNLEELVEQNGGLGEDCVFIGHSIGTFIIMRYLASRPVELTLKIAGAVLIGAWVKIPTTFEALFLGKASMQPWLVPYTEAETERQKSLCPKMLIFIGTNRGCGCGLDPETTLMAAYPWATLHVTNRGHYSVNSFKDGELEAITRLCAWNRVYDGAPKRGTLDYNWNTGKMGSAPFGLVVPHV